MALTRERKVFIGILAAAGGVLAFDMGLLRGPAEASASEGDLGSPEALTISASSSGAAADLLNRFGADLGPGLAGLLESAAQGQQLDLDQTGDAFRWPDAWTEVTRVEAPSPPSGARASITLPKVTSVMPAASGGGLAVIGGRTLRVGQVEPTMNAQIIDIRPGGVVVDLEGRRIMLPIESPATAALQPEPAA
ncbi:MAG: hypothetical protein AAFP26_08625 [Planctomycetota bacterium]